MTLKKFNIAVIGASGVVGREVLSILDERKFPISSIKAFATSGSVGEKVPFGSSELVVEALSEKSFDGVDLAFFGVPAELAKKYCEIAAQKGVICIDKSSAFRDELDVPLVVAEVNKHNIRGFRKRKIIAVPNCVAIPLAQVLSPLNRKAKLKRVVMCSYQAVSGAGKAAVEELSQQVRDLFNMRTLDSSVFGHQIAFNVLPCIPANTPYLEDGSTVEESKVIAETRRILEIPDLAMAVTCVRVPVFNGHSEAVHIEFESAISPEEARDILGKSLGLMLLDDTEGKLFPTPTAASGEDVTLVGRIRGDFSVPHGISLWLSCDNLRTGAALNAVKVAEVLRAEYWDNE